MINAHPKEIAITRGAGYGLNIISNGIKWGRGDNIVINDLEFPANVFTWQLQARKYGLELRIARNINGEIPLEVYDDLIDERTKIIAVSWVEFSNDFRHDLKALSEISHKKGVYLVVDGIQGVGQTF